MSFHKCLNCSQQFMYSGPTDRLPPLTCNFCRNTDIRYRDTISKTFSEEKNPILPQSLPAVIVQRRRHSMPKKTTNPHRIISSHTCSSCFGAFQKEETQFKFMEFLSKLPCGHLYHAQCLKMMIEGIHEINIRAQRGGRIRDCQKQCCMKCNAEFRYENIQTLPSALAQKFFINKSPVLALF